MQRTAAGEVLDVVCTVQAEFVENSERVVLYDVEIAVVAVAGNEIAVLLVPFGVLYAHILGRYHLAVEHQFVAAVLLVVFLHHAQNRLHIFPILVVVVNGYAEELGPFHQSVDPDGEVLAAQVDISCIEQGQHPVAL